MLATLLTSALLVAAAVAEDAVAPVTVTEQLASPGNPFHNLDTYKVAREGATRSIATAQLESMGADDAYGIPDVGYSMLNYYSSGSTCSTDPVKVWMQYGTCIKSTSGSGTNTNSYFTSAPTVSGSTYTFVVKEYSDTNCATQTGQYADNYVVGSCQSNVEFFGISDEFEIESGGATWYTYNTAALCASGDFSDVTGGSFVKMNDCIVYGGGSIKYSSCSTLNIYSTTDCSNTATVYSPAAVCDLSDDGDDDDYNSIEYETYDCKSAGSSFTSAHNVGLASAAAALVLGFLW